MSELGNCWTTPRYHGYAWVTVCLLVLCLPPSFTAVVFPNDVLSSLDKFKPGHEQQQQQQQQQRQHHHSLGRVHAATKSTVPISSSSSSIPSSSDEEDDDSSRPRSLDDSGRYAVFPPLARPSSTEAGGSLTGDLLAEDFFPNPRRYSPPDLSEGPQDMEEDFDYSDYPEAPTRPQSEASPSSDAAESGKEQTFEAVSVSKQLTHHRNHHHQQQQQQKHHQQHPDSVEPSATPDSSKHKTEVPAHAPPRIEETNEVTKGKERQPSAPNYNDPSLAENTLDYDRPTHYSAHRQQHNRKQQQQQQHTTTTSNTQEQQHHQHHRLLEQKQTQEQQQRNEEAANHCPMCQLREADRLYRIETLKRKILDRLHFTMLPNRTGIPVPKVLSHISDIHVDLLQDAPYGGAPNEYFDDEEDDEYTAPERVFATAKELPPYMNSKEENSCFFSIPNEMLQLRVTKAYLWFYVRDKGRAAPPAVVQMRVSRLGPPSKKQRSSKRVIWTHKDYTDKVSGWKRVDVTNVVRRWAKHPSSNYGLEILAMRGDENLAVLPLVPDEFQGYEPTLDIKVTKEAKRRYRRSESLTCSENSTEHRCCRYPLTVSFAEFGWDWVISPTHVKADYCAGECRMTLQNKTPYSWVASQAAGATGSCCTPSKMSALALLYFDNNRRVIYQILQGMKVERCGCP